MKSEPGSALYCATLNSEGLIEYPRTEELLQISAGDTLLLKLPKDLPIANHALVRLNLPSIRNDQLIYDTAAPLPCAEPNPEPSPLATISPSEAADGDLQFELRFRYPGSFFYQIEYHQPDENVTRHTKPEYILVHPAGIVPGGMVLLSVLTRCLGKLARWPLVLGRQAKLGYNTIHFMPVQQYGTSGSMYSIRGHHTVDDWYVEDPKMPAEKRMALLADTVKRLSAEFGLRSIVDVVLNHVAPNSEWLAEHPDGAYNLHNTPHLRVAWEFDKFLYQFSEDYANARVEGCPAAPLVSNEKDLQLLIKALEVRISKLTLVEYFLFDRKLIKQKFEAMEKPKPNPIPEPPQEKNADAKAEEEEEEEVEIEVDEELTNYVETHSSGHGIAPFGVDVTHCTKP